MQYLKFRLLAVLSIVYSYHYGQVKVIPAEYGSNVHTENFFDATVINSGEVTNVTINVLITGSDTALKLQSHFFMLQKGISRIAGSELSIDTANSILQSPLFDSYFFNHNYLPDGEYKINWKMESSSGELLAETERHYTSVNTVRIAKLTDSIYYGEDMYSWTLNNRDEKKDSNIAARIRFFNLKAGKYRPVDLINIDTLQGYIFSPAHILEENFGKGIKGTFFFQVELFYKSISIGNSSKIAVNQPSLHNFKEKKILGIFKPNASGNEKKYLAAKYKVSLPKKDNPLKISGNVVSESGYSNIKYPYQVTPPVYSRLIFNPTVTIYNIPVTARVLLSTENSTVYPVNSFTVGVNTQQLKENFTKKFKELNEFDNQLRQNVETDFKETDTYLKQLEEQKNRYESEIKSYELNNKIPARPSMPTIENINDTIKPDFTDYPALSFPDSLSSIDSAKRAAEYYKLRDNYNKTLYKYEQTRKKVQRLKSFLEKDSMQNGLGGMVRDSLKKMQPSSPAEKFIRSIKNFDIGIVYPVLSENIYKGLPLKGITTSFGFENHFVMLAAGKTIQLSAPDFNNYSINPKFSRKTFIAKAGWGKLAGNHIFVSTAYFKDPFTFIAIDSNRIISPKENHVISIGGKLSMLKKLTLEAELANSKYIDNKAITSTELPGSYSANGLLNKVVHTKGTYAVSPTSSFTVTYKRVGAGYVSLGSPFLRRDFRELEGRIQQSLWDKKISISAFYKYNTDNLSNIKSYQNTINGYGFTLKTKFKKLPNIIVSHTPFEINSEFKPTQYMATGALPALVNRFHLTMANVYYASTKLGFPIVVNVGYLNNVIQNSGGQKISQQSYTASVNFTLPKGNIINTSAGYYKTLPAIDTLNIRFIESGVSFYLFKKVQSTAGVSYHQNNPQMYKLGGFFQSSYTFKHFNFTTRILYNKLKGDWMVNAGYELNAVLSVGYYW